MTNRKIYGYDETLVLLKEAVVERGEDWVYPGSTREADDNEWRSSGSCRYAKYDPEAERVDPHTPACLVGVVFHKTGQMDDRVAEFFGSSDEVIERFDLPFSDLASRLLLHVQANQDSGTPWGESVASAERHMGSDWAIEIEAERAEALND